MKNKIFGVTAALTLSLGLTACNFGDDRAQNDHMDISAADTSTPSSQYPHTKAILVQDAKYKFVQVDPSQADDIQKKLHEEIKKQVDQFRNQLPTQPRTQVPNQGQPNQQYKAPTTEQQQPQQPAKEQQQQEQQPTGDTKGIGEYAQRVIDLTNQERAKAGLSALKADAELSRVAQKKSEDMQQNNYFSHTSPTYGSPFDMMRDFGISYKTAGENIAQGQRTPEEVVNAWMNSEGHRKNILSNQFTHIGVGYESKGNHWTQMFIGK